MVIRGSEKIEPLKYVDNKKIDFDIILAIEKSRTFNFLYFFMQIYK